MNSPPASIQLIYDGDCPMCRTLGKTIKIREAVGRLEIINARESHPILEDIQKKGLDLDEGIVVHYQNKFYHGADALHLLALLSSNYSWFNRLNAFLFRSAFFSKLSYPILKNIRNALLCYKGISKINNLQRDTRHEPIFKSVFGEKWDTLPPVMRQHYRNHPFSNDVVTVQGKMTIQSSGVLKFFLPLFKFFKVLAPHEGENIPVTVYLRSDPHSYAFHFDRTFYFPDKKPYHFRSYMLPIKNNIVVEFVFAGIGWCTAFISTGNKVILEYKGFVWKIFGLLIPLPLAFLFGKVHLEKEALSDNTFRLHMEMNHWIGNYIYAGEFKILTKNF